MEAELPLDIIKKPSLISKENNLSREESKTEMKDEK